MRMLEFLPVPRSAVFVRTALAVALMAVLSAQASAQTQGVSAPDAGKKDTTQLGEITVTGSRAKGHTVADSPSPIDMIGKEAMQSSGTLEVGRLLQTLEPSANFSTTFVSDGTDLIRPLTLRGLGPDQTLILVNGKRRHQQALVNVQQTIGRGSAGYDINSIPESMIDHIEVLRDGAAAQYGSDAIAGVVNIILKKNVDETDLSVQGGKTYAGDGALWSGSVDTGFTFGPGGYTNIALEYRDRGATNRAGPDSLRVDPPRVTQNLGDAHTKDAYLWLNGGLPIGGGELYWFGGYSRRTGVSNGFFRSAGDGRTVPAVYPNGFLPELQTKTVDGSAAVGYRGPLEGTWSYDVSLEWGQNKFDFHEGNTINVSWWYEPKPDGSGIYGSSPLSAFTGALEYRHVVFDADLKGSIDWGMSAQPVFIGTGFEYRDENYRITPGDLVSYSYGRTNNRSIVILNQTGGIAAPGTQGFPGWTPATAVDDGRHNFAVYVDAENQLTEKFDASAALRYEHYSDFGSNVTGKLTGRFDFTDSFALRGTLTNGFRAPGVQQQFYSQVSTNLNSAGVLTDTLTARQNSAVTQAFGVPPLKEETSVSGSLGVVTRLGDDTRFTADAYRIDIDNRIIFSSNIAPEAGPCAPDLSNCPIAKILAPLGVGQVLFFTNAINTRTTGLDLVLEHDMQLANDDKLVLSASANFGHTEVTKRKSPSKILPPNVLFDDTQVTLIEKGQPRQHAVLSADYTHGPWNGTLRANYFGSVAGQGFTPGFIQEWGGKWLFDLNVSYAFNDQAKLSAGGLNIFDTYPDKWDPVKAFPFPQLGFKYGWETTPFGINGGSWYIRFDYKFK